MKLTRMQLLIAGGLLIVAGIVLFILIHTTSSKDTPVVVAGGSIYGKTAKNDGDGWTTIQPQILYSASTHETSPGIDWLDFELFESPPSPNPVIKTQGWAISYSVPDGNGGVVPYALRYCSDQTCSASKVLMDGTTNKSVCSGASSFSASTPVYLGVNSAVSGLQLDETKSGKITSQLVFDDVNLSCSPGSGNKCNHIHDVTLEVCNGTTYAAAFTCKNPNCYVQVGTP